MTTTASPRRLGTMDHLRLTVSDIAAARAFYAPIMAFMNYRLVEETPDRLHWRMPSPLGGPCDLILTAAHHDAARRHDRYAPGLHHFCWSADSREQVDALYAVLLEHGLTVLDSPAEYTYDPGYYAVFFADPDGMKLELAHVP